MAMRFEKKYSDWELVQQTRGKKRKHWEHFNFDAVIAACQANHKTPCRITYFSLNHKQIVKLNEKTLILQTGSQLINATCHFSGIAVLQQKMLNYRVQISYLLF